MEEAVKAAAPPEVEPEVVVEEAVEEEVEEVGPRAYAAMRCERLRSGRLPSSMSRSHCRTTISFESASSAAVSASQPPPCVVASTTAFRSLKLPPTMRATRVASASVSPASLVR